MGLIKDMHSKNAPKGMMLPKPTTDGDDQIIAAKTGEYVLTPEMVQALGGAQALDALAMQITGEQPGGRPAMMPGGKMGEGMGMMPDETMGHARGGKVQGYARGGIISQIEKGLSNAMTVGASLMPDPVQKRAVDPMEDVRRWMPDTLQTGVINPMAEGLAPTGKKRQSLSDLASMGLLGEITPDQVYGYADGGMIDDPLRPVGQGVGASTTRPSIQSLIDDKYRAERLNPGSATPRPAAAQGVTQPRVTPTSGINYDLPPGKRVGTASTGEFDAARRATSSVANPSVTSTVAVTPKPTSLAGTAQQPAAATQGRAYSAGKSTGAFARRAAGPVSKLAAAAAVPVYQAAEQFVTGDDADARNAFYNDTSVPWTEKAKQFGRDAAGIALPAAGTVIGAGMGGGLVSVATGAGGYMAGKGANNALQSALGESPLDRYKIQQPQQGGNALMTDQERSDEIARRRAALEGPQSTPAPTQAVASALRAAPRSAPARAGKGLIAGLAQQQQPQQDPALQAAIDASPIASVQSGPVGPEGANGHVVSYKDGRQAFVQQLPEDAKAWYAMTARAGGNSPVEIIKGSERFVASPESGYQAVPKFVADAGQTGNYVKSAAQGWIDRSAPLAADARNRIAEINAQGKKQVDVFNATDRGAKGRSLSNQAAEIALKQAQQRAKLEEDLLNGTPEQQAAAAAKLNRLPGKDGDGGRSKLVSDLVKSYASSTTSPNAAEMEAFVRQGLALAGGTVQPNSAPAGMKQVGTSGGKPVYQDAKGNRFIGD
ncbi:hypothetical protein LLG90_08235 [Aromatoleum toluclasticum]|uniref:hypothetical protein n=1 Tax=Aromatoleum toluclasticum TaxID=92003 RepID=UPI001D183F45|nr:hypothetical protein [Aromatoleum toluclasticum]MCC4115332.1 hypothetical protein [Aromatoleum toluclasticum]